MCRTKMIKTTHYESPCGTLTLGAFGERLCLCDWETAKHREYSIKRLKKHLHAGLAEGTSHVIQKTVEELNEFFVGRRKEFDIPVLMCGTDFQKTVWEELLKIPFGTTISYSETARRIGTPKSIRPVATAIAANSLSIIIPCHRVIGNNRSLTGYRGGLTAKRILLKTEGFSFK